MSQEKKGKVISIKSRIALRSLTQTIKTGLIYQSFQDELVDLRNREEKDYFRLVYFIPGEDIEDPEIAVDNQPGQVFMMMDMDEEDLPIGQGDGVERYEIHDMVTDDIHIMYRVPFRRTPLRAVEPKSQSTT